LGRVSEIVDRNARTRTFGYDINDNLTTEAWDNGTNLTYTYDKVGNLKTSVDGSSNTTDTYTYDAIYQLVSAATSNSNVGFEYAYDEFGDLIRRKDKQGTVTSAQLDYSYNNNHQLTRLVQSGVGLSTQTIEMGYDRLSQLTRIDRTVASNPGHVITDYGYDGAGRLGSIDHQFNSSVISNYNYGYDDGSRLSGKGGTDGISTVAYGNDNQISAVNNTTRPDEAYSFDALGIRAGWVTDALDKRQVLNDGSYLYLYDDEGNLTQKQEIATGKVTTYTWDYRNRLTKVTSGSQVVEYGYDAQDRRVGKKVNGVTQERYVYDGDDIALVVDASGTILERYLYGDGTDNVLSHVSAGDTVWSLGDRQGSVVDLVDEGGNVLNHFVYDSFGNRTATTGVDFRFGYTGRELDSETGLYYYRARYYDSQLGRFISEDPIGFNAGDTNLYRYVKNSPTNWTDPTGKFANVAAGAGFGALFGGLYALANDIESGQFGWNTFGNVLKGAAVGAVTGAVVASGVGLLAAGATAAFGTSVAGAIVNTTFVAGATAYGAYNAGGNFGSGKYLTGALDLFGVVAGAKNVFSGVTRNIPQMAYAEVKARRANLAAMYPPDPNPPGYQRQIYQVGDPQLNSSGAIVPAQSSTLANRTSVGGAIDRGSINIFNVIITTNNNSPAGAYSSALNGKIIGEKSNRLVVKQSTSTMCGSACGEMLLRQQGVTNVSQEEIYKSATTGWYMEDGTNYAQYTDPNSIARALNNFTPPETGRWVGGAPADLPLERFLNLLNKPERIKNHGSWAATIGQRGEHFVFVKGFDKKGNVKIYDPWGIGDESKNFNPLEKNGSSYSVTVDDFLTVWDGRAVFKQK
jgi:RHS repeat-associated protein